MDVKAYTEHFRRMAAGQLCKGPKGYYVQTGGKNEPKLTVISPVEAAVNLAKSEVKQQKVNKASRTPAVHKARRTSKVTNKGRRGVKGTKGTKISKITHKGRRGVKDSKGRPTKSKSTTEPDALA